MNRPVGQLEVSETAIRVPGGTVRNIEGTREAVAAHVRTDDHRRYRPLSGAKTLPTNWEAPLGPGFDADDAIEAVYPLALVHSRQYAEGRLRVVSLDDVLARQSGRYESTSALSEGGRRRAVRTVCGTCVRRPVWDNAPCAPGEIPCPEPCSVLVAFCREAALWEADPPVAVTPDSSVAWAAFDQPGNELREQYLQEMDHADE